MTIMIWNETYRPVAPAQTFNPDLPGVSTHRGPHTLFVQDCMLAYKRMNWTSFVAIVDTDEFVAVNNATRSPGNQNSRDGVPSNSEPGSVTKFLKQEQYRRDRLQLRTPYPHCFRMHRLQMCYDEQPTITGGRRADPNNANNNRDGGGDSSDVVMRGESNNSGNNNNDGGRIVPPADNDIPLPGFSERDFLTHHFSYAGTYTRERAYI